MEGHGYVGIRCGYLFTWDIRFYGCRKRQVADLAGCKLLRSHRVDDVNAVGKG